VRRVVPVGQADATQPARCHAHHSLHSRITRKM
jgi:hypothetical protein